MKAFIICVCFTAHVFAGELPHDSYHYLKANQALIESNFAVAIDEFSKAIEEFPDSLYLISQRGIAYEKDRQFTKAVEDLDFVINHPNVKTWELISALFSRKKIYSLEKDFVNCEIINDWLQ